MLAVKKRMPDGNHRTAPIEFTCMRRSAQLTKVCSFQRKRVDTTAPSVLDNLPAFGQLWLGYDTYCVIVPG